MKARIISADGTTMIEHDLGPNDKVNIGRGASIIGESIHSAMVDIAGSSELLDEGLGVIRTDSMAGLTLDQIKTRCKRKVTKQAEAAFALKYSIFEVCLGIKAGAGKPAYDNMMADAAAYKQALATAKAAINASTTADDAIAVAFVSPA